MVSRSKLDISRNLFAIFIKVIFKRMIYLKQFHKLFRMPFRFSSKNRLRAGR